ncbi:MAG: A/G-specific adenine glycosylase [Oscillospiraceae bacterium]|nr:A/G-specific adenine glycosylase [Oscillospiraceae bacterium]
MSSLSGFAILLLQWYEENKRTLPWRSNPDPYWVLVSETMLQQTRVSAVLPYFRRFIEELPTVAHLARVEDERLLKLWQGLGYYNRARNLKKAAAQILAGFGGRFPDTYEEILTLAGVGEYTAGAISSIAFGIPAPAVDGNVLRVMARITGSRADITKPQTKRAFRELVWEMMPAKRPGDFNQAMMELGATVCMPNGAPCCARCPAGAFCRAFLEGVTGELPVKTKKPGRRVEERTVYLIFHGGAVALRKRPDKGLLAGLWEYPNEPREKEDALALWGFHGAAEPAGSGKHLFTHVEWRMTGQALHAGEERLPPGWVWADRRELNQVYALPSAFQCFAERVRWELGRDWKRPEPMKGEKR